MLRVIPILLVSAALAFAAAAQSVEAELVLAHQTGLRAAAWNADETRILTAEGSGSIHVWSAQAGERLLSFGEEGKSATHALWAGDGASILSADETGAARLNDASDGAEVHRWQLRGIPIALELNAAETAALFFTSEGEGAILSLVDGAMLARFELDGDIGGAVWSADETVVRAWTEAGSIRGWDLESGDTFEYTLPNRSLLLGLDWNADETRLLAWFANGAAQIYETDGGSVHGRALSGLRHRSFVKRAVWSSDESMVMSWAGDDTVHIWSVDGGVSQRVFRHDDWVIGAIWEEDASRVLSWSHIYLYLWENEDAPRRFRHRNLVSGAVWSRDGERMLSWSWDGTARVWRP